MMNEFENIKIEQLPGNNKEHGLDQSQLKEYFNDKFFGDLESGNVSIKKQWDMYIFEQKDAYSTTISDSNHFVNRFMVKEKVFQEFLEDNLVKDEITLESDALLKKFFSTVQSKKELSGLEKEVVSKNKETKEWEKPLQLRDNPEALLVEVDNLLDRFEKNQTWPKAPRIKENRYSKVRFIQVVRDDILLLKSIKRELNKYDYTTNVDYFANTVDILKSHKEQLEKVRQMITTGQNTAEIPSILRSIDDVRKESLFQNIAAKYNVEFNRLMKDLTLKKLWNKDAEWFQEYLEWVWSGDIEHAEQSPFFMRYKKDFEYIASINPQLYLEITTAKQKTNNPNPKYCSNEYNMAQLTRNNRYIKQPWTFDKIGNMLSELMYKWDDPKKKEARAQAGKLWAIIWWIVLWFQFFKNLFAKKGTEWKRTKTALYGWWLLALLNFNKLADWTKTVTGKTGNVEKTFGVDQSPIYQDYMSPAITSMEAIGWIPIKTLVGGRIVVEKYWKLNLDYDKYVEMINVNMNLSDKEKKNAIKAADKIKADGNLLHNGLWLLGISSVKDLEALSGQDDSKTLLDTDKMGNHFENVVSPVNSTLATEWFKPKDAKSWHTISQEYDPSNFGNDTILDRINRWLIILKNNKNYNLDDMKNNSEINLLNKSINGLKNSSGQDIKFKTYEELFNTAKLTSFIKNNFKWQSAVSTEPFHSTFLWTIEFDNTKWYEAWKNETDVIKSNFYKNTLKGLSPTLDQYKDSYVKYLNDWREVEWKNS